LKIKTIIFSYKGKRKLNEDYIGKSIFSLKRNKALLLAVADGMGGYKGGDVASRKAVEFFLTEMRKCLRWSNSLDRIRFHLKSTYKKINRQLYQEGLANKELQEMGTTLASLVLVDNKYLIANVGDSRAYYMNNEEIIQITEDHSALAEAIKEGLYSPSEIAKMPYQHALTRSLGNKEAVEVDIFPERGYFEAKDGEIIFFLTDGITSTVSELELYERIISTNKLKKAAKDIVSLAYRKGSTDNMSIALLELGKLYRKKYLAPGYTLRTKKIKRKKRKL
jgi:serine/threonine protein phosphatase PrpC